MLFIKKSFIFFLLLTSCLYSDSETSQKQKVDVLIIGSGAGGLTSAIYLARGGASPYVLEGNLPGGAITQSSGVENWPGEFSISGLDLIDKIRTQAEKNGVILSQEELVSVDLSSKPFVFQVRNIYDPSSVKEITTDVCNIATGSKPRSLEVPGEEKYKFKGVYTCAICDGSLYKDKVVAVVGGGDSAVLEADYLSGIAKKVYVFVRKDHFRAKEKSRIKQIEALPNVEIVYGASIQEIKGTETEIQSALVAHTSGEVEEVSLDAIFLAVGSTPNSQLFSSSLEVDTQGYIVLKEHFETSVPGVFAIGDVTDPLFKQAISAAGDGAKAAIQAQMILSSLKNKKEIKEAPKSFLGTVVEVTSLAQLQEILESNQPVLLDFYATWCGPCRRLTPFVESSAKKLEGDFVVCKVNVDAARELASCYKIRAMPTVVHLDKQGKEVTRKEGMPEIVSYINSLK